MRVILQAADSQGLSESTTALVVAAFGGIITVLVAVLGAWVTAAKARNDRRREVYSKATKSALAWTEMVYRVRRRRADHAHEIVGRFHDVQEEIAFYKAWIGGDSVYLQRSFIRLVKAVKTQTEPLIQEAWKQELRDYPGDALRGDKHPKLEPQLDDFLKDVRSHLSLWPWRWVAVAWRNRKRKRRKKK